MNFDLPSTGTEQPPAFATATACHNWLTAVPLTSVTQAQAMFLRQLTLLACFALPKGERFAVLEALRDPLRRVQESATKKICRQTVASLPAGTSRTG